MDPLAGLSLACNIMQVIQFSAETLAVFKRMKDGVSLDAYVETNRQSLVTAMEKLKSTLSTPSVLNGVPRDASLLQVCNEIVTVSDALHKQVQKSWPDRGASKARMLRKSVAYQLKYKSATEKLTQQLDRLQNRMESEILISLRQALIQDQSEMCGRFQNLDNDLRNFHDNLIAGQTHLEGLVDRQSGQIKKAIRDESQKTRERIIQSAQETRDFIDTTESERISDTAYQQFLESFRFPGMNARRNAIEISHPDTFQWIFKEPEKTKQSDNKAPKWSSFPAWLRGGTGTYWISGKAGAGKSTLMKYLLGVKTTRDILSENSSDTMIISAFIWSLGTSMQKSLVGVLCTLLYEVFALNRDICRQMMREKQSDFHLKRETSDWSLQELELLFSSVVRKCPCPVSVFIDGLDEIDRTKPTEMTSLMRWLENISALRTVQVCVSSRPEPIFENRLRQYSHLRVQDLTAKDIEHYVTDRVRSLEFNFDVPAQDIQDLVESIVSRAEGVFLWAHLVVEHIRTDTENFSSWETLYQRVEELPSGLHQMYKAMWERYNSDSDIYRAETAFNLNTLLVNQNDIESGHLLLFMLKSNVDIQIQILRGGETVSIYSLVKECPRFDANAVARCGGLITTSGIPTPRLLPELDEGQRRLLETRILGKGDWFMMSFGHRSAADFLLNTSTGRDILQYDRATAIEHAIGQAKALLCHYILTEGHHAIGRAMTHVSPLLQEFRTPDFTSAIFDLCVEGCGRRPNFLKRNIWADLLHAGFLAEVQDQLQRLPSEELYQLKVQLLAYMCKDGTISTLPDVSDFMVELLHCVRPQELSNNTPFLLHRSLVGHLFTHAEDLLFGRHDRTTRRFVDLLLQKCGGIEGLSKSRVLVMLPHYSSIMQSELPTESRWYPCSTVPTRFHAELDLRDGRTSRAHAALVETSILDVFFAEDSLLQRYVNSTQGLSPARRTCLQKPVMVVRLDTERNDITGEYNISGFDSKPIYHVDTRLDLEEQLGSKYSSGKYSDLAFKGRQKLDSKKTLDLLIRKGYLSRECVDPVNPLRALLDERVLARAKPPQLSDIDWSFEIDCECLEQASRDVVEKERKAGNPKAISPCKGGMLLWEATKQWNLALWSHHAC
ncbi:hypothetical protein SLS60_005233 [Paraconiothyrium brasiliense]|uniref:Nephrocystin 3-like N-terminal domain-containing protein n=1 Tax=Paraconiothyrium brasiliense TaxID=300254 RepID=A0ABR3RGT3_9PLEO